MKKLILLLGMLIVHSGFVSGELLDDLANYYDFEQTFGNLEDQVGNQDSKYVRIQGSKIAEGINGNAWDFEGSGTPDCVRVSNQVITKGEVSINVWVKWESLSHNEAFVWGYYNSQTRVNSLQNPGTQAKFRWATNVREDAKIITEVPSTTEWTMYTWTYSDATKTGSAYINGTFVGSLSHGGIIGRGGQDFTIGNIAVGSNSCTTANRGFDGLIDEVGIWNRSLTSDEINQLYNNGNGKSYPFHGSDITLIYPLDKANVSKSVDLTYNVSIDMDNCTLWINNSGIWGATQSTTDLSASTTHYFDISEFDFGPHMWNVQCFNDTNEYWASTNISFNLLPDTDGDGIPDPMDNCFDDVNPDQEDIDSDDIGDVCDNCINIANEDQNNSDQDNLGDVCDNCPDDDNADQVDIDGDGAGDVCDVCPNDPDDDLDGDTLCGDVDNCPANANPGQGDADIDGIGNACDNCPINLNPEQENYDNDTLGDVCDFCTDIDNDGYGNPGFPMNFCPEDNCPHISNINQSDVDEDTIGDVCDVCADDPLNDEDDDFFCVGNDFKLPKLGGNDNCPIIPNTNQADNDTDLIGDVCDECTDTDDDGFGNPGFPVNTCKPDDNCPFNSNPDQSDVDNDGIGNACDICTDFDGDGFGDPGFNNLCELDNCPLISNDQTDSDNDTFGNVCDNCFNVSNLEQTDLDNDDFGNVCDNCPGISNSDQTDTNEDDIGDACTGTALVVDRNIALSDGWNLFGYSLEEPYDWSKATVTDGTETKTLAEAQAAGWLQATIYYFSGPDQYYKFVPGDDDHLRTWNGYWLYSDRELTLILS
jgi:hypothetical protein